MVQVSKKNHKAKPEQAAPALMYRAKSSLDAFITHSRATATAELVQTAAGIVYLLNVNFFRDKDDADYLHIKAAKDALIQAVKANLGDLHERTFIRRLSLITGGYDKIKASATVFTTLHQALRDAPSADDAVDALLGFFEAKKITTLSHLMTTLGISDGKGNQDDLSPSDKAVKAASGAVKRLAAQIKDGTVSAKKATKTLAEAAPAPMALVRMLIDERLSDGNLQELLDLQAYINTIVESRLKAGDNADGVGQSRKRRAVPAKAKAEQAQAA